MHPLEKKTLEIIGQEGLLTAGERIVVGVSAGPDSTALLHVLARLAPVLDITLAAVYVNHGLRPAEAAQEKNLVAAAAARLDVAFFPGSVDVRGLAAREKLSIEQAARMLRYDFLEKTARAWGSRKIALAHTADDQTEEILLRLIRGTARKGLSGMKTLRAGRYIRPFLQMRKSRLLRYLDRYTIPFLHDSSNSQNLYLRNRIRNDLLPYLAAKYNPGIRQTLLRTANILQDEELLLERMTTAAFAETVAIIATGTEAAGNDDSGADFQVPRELQLHLARFALQPRAIQRRLLERSCWVMASEPRASQIEQLLHLARPDSSGATLHLAGGLRVIKNPGHLCFVYPSGHGPFRGNLPAAAGGGLPETSIPAPGSYEFPIVNRRLVVTEVSGVIPTPGDSFPRGEFLDADLFSFPLTIRSPDPGDRFHPLGAPGGKKIAAFLSDRKIGAHLWLQVPVLCSAGAILALPGLRIDHRYRITADSSRAIRVTWEEME